jgi:hypothetical protein
MEMGRRVRRWRTYVKFWAVEAVCAVWLICRKKVVMAVVVVVIRLLLPCMWLAWVSY